MPSRPRVRLMPAFVLAAAAAVAAQQTPPAQKPPQTPPPQITFRAGIDLVRVDAIATDDQDRVVADLTPEDFEIKEGGKVQAIESFKFVQIDDEALSESATREITSLDQQAREAEREDVRMIVIFIDDYHIMPHNALATRDRLASFVRKISPRDLVAVMYPLTPVAGLTFSRNRDAQAEIIAGLEGRKFDFFPRNAFDELCQLSSANAQQALRDRLSSRTLKSLFRYLGAVREGRKMLLFVGEGLGEQVPSYLTSRASGGPLPCNKLPDAPFPTLTDLAIENNVAMYTMDTRGVESDELDMRQTLDQATTQRATVARMQEQLRNEAYLTNGRAMVGTNNYEPILDQMLRDGGSYYLLGYRLADARRDGRFHEISVRVKRDGVRIRARKGYLALDEETYRRAMAPPPPPLPADVAEALSALAASTAPRALRVWVGVTKGEAGRANLTAVWTYSSPSEGRPATDPPTVRFTALSEQGGRVFDGPAPAESRTPGTGHASFTARSGPLMMRAVATADGVVLDREQLEIVVPDFSAPLTFGTPAVFRARTARDVQLIRANSSPVPTVDRVFSRTEQLLVRVPVYGPDGATTAVSLRLLDSAGQPKMSLPAPTAVADGVWEAEVSLATFAAADYVLEIHATSGEASARTLVAIRIVQ